MVRPGDAGQSALTLPSTLKETREERNVEEKKEKKRKKTLGEKGREGRRGRRVGSKNYTFVTGQIPALIQLTDRQPPEKREG